MGSPTEGFPPGTAASSPGNSEGSSLLLKQPRMHKTDHKNEQYLSPFPARARKTKACQLLCDSVNLTMIFQKCIFRVKISPSSLFLPL